MNSWNTKGKKDTDGSKSSGNLDNHTVLPLCDSPCDDVTHWVCKLSKEETNRDDT